MRNLVVACALSLSLAACATTSLPGPSGSPAPTAGGSNAGAIVSQVQSATVAACKFLPTAQTVLNIVSTFTDVSALGPVASVAQAICNAVAAPPGRLGRRGTPRVHGVAIKGRFVK
jgi:hypothetical protein